MPHKRGGTIAEVLAVTSLVVLLLVVLVAVFLPALGNGGPHPRMQNNTQIRGIHQALIMYAQGNGGFYPGLDASGAPALLNVHERFKTLLDGNYFVPDYLISPSETASHIHEWKTGPFTSDHYSYAMLQVPAAGGRYAEWSETLNPNAIVMADRNTGTTANPASIYTGQRRRAPSGCSWLAGSYRGWAGGIAFNDNAVEFVDSHRHATEYAGQAYADDHLFDASSDDDAYLVHSGN